MNRKVLLGLIICDVLLALLTLGYSMLVPILKQIPWTDWSPVFYDIFGGMAATVVFALLMAAFTWATFQTTKTCIHWQRVMVINALISSVVGVSVGWLLFFFAGWLHMLGALAYMRVMFWCGILTIVLSFPLKRLRRKGLVA